MNQNRETDYIIHSVTFVYRGTTLDRQLNPNDQAPQNYIKTCQHKLGCRQKYLKTTLHWVCFAEQCAITGYTTQSAACGIDNEIEMVERYKISESR